VSQFKPGPAYDPEGDAGMEGVQEELTGEPASYLAVLHNRREKITIHLDHYEYMERRIIELTNENDRLKSELDYWHSRYAEDQGG